MEYLQREFSQLGLNNDFHFLPRCKRLGVMHVCFADDLLMFCKADLKSIKLLQDAFLKFSRASGLQENPNKSSGYIACINERMKELILRELGYNEGSLPFKYLGVPLAPKKLSNQQCRPLVEKITARISCWTSKLLSYSGRFQLIKSVIFRMQSYWAQKSFGSMDRVCLPQTMGGLNVINLCNWNKAAIVKHLWAITKKKDCLWIRWIHSYYIKNRSIDTMTIPKSAAWVVRKIIEQRKFILNLPSLQGNEQERLESLQNTNGKFSIKKLYNLQTPQGQKVYWKSLILHPHIHPRHKFNLWLAIQRRLPTDDRLQKIGIQVAQIQAWEEELHWVVYHARKKKGIGNIIVAVFGMLIYSLWRHRNLLRFQNGSTSAAQICREITTYVHIKSHIHSNWQEHMEALNRYP
ncbi:PREDICTED: uncharacterized protein LOC109207224 [Nicotiana attenuata]|uniref:uncharacterized protein LOC109207224 n=1 Tax=Nicotiana attenuata TaxID=49451 RepID=UPI000904FC2B|nr:PREDICTED: uncharacterized protein LOC109207224 [Nicotiana attenuata]